MQYEEMYQRSISDPDGFWSEIADQFHWQKRWEGNHTSNLDIRKGPIQIKVTPLPSLISSHHPLISVSFFTLISLFGPYTNPHPPSPPAVQWFDGGTTNICYNAIDRHVAQGRGSDTAFIWEGNTLGRQYSLTYQELLDKVCQVANYLRSVGVNKGSFVALYMPMLAELPIAMLACARIGAVHSVRRTASLTRFGFGFGTGFGFGFGFSIPDSDSVSDSEVDFGCGNHRPKQEEPKKPVSSIYFLPPSSCSGLR